MTVPSIAALIDHAVLHPMHTDLDLEQACALADQWKTAAICVKPHHVLQATALLSESPVSICSVIGFPHGNSSIEVKVQETIDALTNGASEIDMVINIGKVIQGDWGYINNEITAVFSTCEMRKALLKVIFENDYLHTDDQKVMLCEICSKIGVAFVKTSTGFGFVKMADDCYAYNGATEHDVMLMRKHAGDHVQIKASGGIRSLDDLLRFNVLGATRIGTSSTGKILKEAMKRYG